MAKVQNIPNSLKRMQLFSATSCCGGILSESHEKLDRNFQRVK